MTWFRLLFVLSLSTLVLSSPVKPHASPPESVARRFCCVHGLVGPSDLTTSHPHKGNPVSVPPATPPIPPTSPRRPRLWFLPLEQGLLQTRRIRGTDNSHSSPAASARSGAPSPATFCLLCTSFLFMAQEGQVTATTEEPTERYVPIRSPIPRRMQGGRGPPSRRSRVPPRRRACVCVSSPLGRLGGLGRWVLWPPRV